MIYGRRLSYARICAALSGAVIIVSFFASSMVRAAAPPNIVTYQGRILNANGVPIGDASATMVFRLCDSLAGACTTSGDSCLWESDDGASCDTADAATSVPLADGLFSQDLGNAAYPAIPDSVFADNSAVYLEVSIGGETLSPRKRLTAAPYAVNSQTLDGLDSTDFLQTGDLPAGAGLWETGINGTFEDDDDVLIGATAETIADSGFSLSGDDLFVAGSIGSEGSIYTDGSLLAAGDLTLDGGDLLTTSSDLTITTGGAGDLLFHTDDDSSVFLSSDAIANAAGPVYGLLNLDLNLATGTNTVAAGMFVSSDAPVDSGDAAVGIGILMAAGPSGTSSNAIAILDTTATSGFTTGISIGVNFDKELAFEDPTAWLSFGELLSFGEMQSIVFDNLTGDITTSGVVRTSGISAEAGFGISALNNLTLNTSAGFIDLNTANGVHADIIGSATTNGVCHSGGASDTSDITIVDCSGAPSDIAEWYETVSGVAEGDIVVVTPATFTYQSKDIDAFTGNETGTLETHTLSVLDRATQPYQGTILGVVSTSPAQTYGEGVLDTATHPQPIAVAGRVPTRVSDENGPIEVGDPITSSSVTGIGMKSTEPGKIVGYALQPWNGAGTGRIMVYLSPTWNAGNVIGTDGTSIVLTDSVVLAPLATASADAPAASSNIFSLRGSAWNGAAAESVAMSFTNEVTSASSYRLSIKNTSGSEVAYVSSAGVMKAFGDLVVGGNIYPSDRGAAQSSKYIYYDGDAGPGGDMMRTNAAGWSTGSYDFAEMFPSSEELIPGEVVTFAASGAFVRRARAEDDVLAGIVSTRPGFLAGENLDGHYPIALAGRVPTRVNLENGSIAVGDPLTASSTAGEAMRATVAGDIVGYALEPYDGSSDGTILVFVNASYWSPALGRNPLAGTSNGSSGFSGGGANLAALNMEGDIYLGGNAILNVGRISGLAGAWSIEEDGTVKTTATLQTIIASYQGEDVETTAVTSREVLITLSGTAELDGGTAVIRFEDVDPSFNDITSTSAPIRVIVTPSGPVSLYVSERSNNGFTVREIGGASSGVAFDWQVTAYRKDFEPVDILPTEPSPVEDPSPESPPSDEIIIDPLPDDSSEDEIVDPSAEDSGGDSEPVSESPSSVSSEGNEVTTTE